VTYLGGPRGRFLELPGVPHLPYPYSGPWLPKGRVGGLLYGYLPPRIQHVKVGGYSPPRVSFGTPYLPRVG